MHGTPLIILEIFAGIAFLTVLGAAIGVVMGRMFGTEPPGGKPESILRQRYARGELTREQYQQMRWDLGLGSEPVPGPVDGPQAPRRDVAGGSQHAAS